MTGEEQDDYKPKDEVQIEPYDRDDANPNQGEKDGQNDELAEGFVCASRDLHRTLLSAAVQSFHLCQRLSVDV